MFAVIGGAHVRAYEWVEICPPDRTLDPAGVGRIVAAMHRVEYTGRRPEDPWYTDPVGAAAWDELIGDLSAAGAPFAGDMAAIRDALVALEALIEPARELRTCHRDLWADNLRPTAAGGMCVIDWENCGLADPGQELSGVLFEFWRGDPDRARALYREYRRSRRARAGRRARELLDDDRPARPHHRDLVPGLARPVRDRRGAPSSGRPRRRVHRRPADASP